MCRKDVHSRTFSWSEADRALPRSRRHIGAERKIEAAFKDARRIAVPQEVNRIANRRQRIAQLMRQHRDELVLATVRLDQFFRRLTEPLFRLHTFSNVDGDTAPSFGRAIQISNCKLADERMLKNPIVML